MSVYLQYIILYQGKDSRGTACTVLRCCYDKFPKLPPHDHGCRITHFTKNVKLSSFTFTVSPGQLHHCVCVSKTIWNKNACLFFPQEQMFSTYSILIEISFADTYQQLRLDTQPYKVKGHCFSLLCFCKKLQSSISKYGNVVSRLIIQIETEIAFSSVSSISSYLCCMYQYTVVRQAAIVTKLLTKRTFFFCCELQSHCNCISTAVFGSLQLASVGGKSLSSVM